jgi:hypothetical protein
MFVNLAALLGVFLLSASVCSAAALPGPVVPDGLGVNIHFTTGHDRDLDMIQTAGFRFVRMDFFWDGVEEERGVYDFSAYDELTNGLAKRGLRALYILDYENRLYESDRSVRTEEGRQAFARFAADAAARYRGKNVIWELWNEPNGGFWGPAPNADDYMKLAKVVFPAIRKADPEATCVAPGTSGVDLGFLEACFKQGLLELVDAVTVHPYRQSAPETAVADYSELRTLIARYRSGRPDLPILSGEWGYSSAWEGYDEQRQGLYLEREFLTNLSRGIPLSIWYDWHDDGQDPEEPEHHFGTVRFDYTEKPAYLAAKRLIEALKGTRFAACLSGAPDYVLLFSDGKHKVIAAWTTGAPHEVEPTPGLKINLTAQPQYLPMGQ